jgi:hypothetical protein
MQIQINPETLRVPSFGIHMTLDMGLDETDFFSSKFWGSLVGKSYTISN